MECPSKKGKKNRICKGLKAETSASVQTIGKKVSVAEAGLGYGRAEMSWVAAKGQGMKGFLPYEGVGLSLQMIRSHCRMLAGSPPCLWTASLSLSLCSRLHAQPEGAAHWTA